MTAAHGLAALPESTAVAIAGGGPSGMFAALSLARAGIASVIVEPRTQVDRLRPRAKTTNARTMTLLRGLGLAERIRAAAALPVSYSQDVVFCTGLAGYELRRFHGAFQLAQHAYGPAPECGQQIPQPVVEEVLREAVAAEALITFVTGVEARGVRADALGAVLMVGAAAGPAGQVPPAHGGTAASGAAAEEVRELRARFVIGADGGSSRVRKSLGLSLAGTSAPRPNFNIVFRSRLLRERVRIPDAVQWWVVGERPGMIGQLDQDGTWWTILQGCDDPHDDAVAADFVRELAGVGADLDVDVLASDPWTARMLLADHYTSPAAHRSVFLVGDAAHLNPPWGGHGFNTCVGDADNLAWKIAAVEQGWADPELLDSYEAERRPVAARMIADAAANGARLASDFAAADLTADSPAGRAARKSAHEALAAKSSEFHSEGLVFGYEYTASPWVTPDGAPTSPVDPIVYTPAACPGQLLPHLRLADGTSAYDLVTGFTLFLLADSGPTAKAQGRPAGEKTPAAPGPLAPSGARTASQVRAAAAAAGIPLTVVELSGPDAAAAGGAWEARAVLVRPDHHVAARLAAGAQSGRNAESGGEEDGAAIIAALLRAVGRPSAQAETREPS
ncbi:FAD-dependent monooxygenase [Brevibacterium sp. BRM-1]|uniref:FAD-dependent monooxygenase n=1 Tax=Brevibacterium sp. BRM-1 TaxID=2999062 RepID=UPI00228258F0|nr:FAD-dependent monooxygenase [Brevibacterium sp. BRM-1]WAL39761.1 FAD-dependent monooxygenase [Brevibacterium sp. BRM-1]